MNAEFLAKLRGVKSPIIVAHPSGEEQAKLIETSNIAWAALLALDAGFPGMGLTATFTAYLASLPRSPTGLSPGSPWVNAAGNQLNWVP
jgi:hypothetical protein